MRWVRSYEQASGGTAASTRSPSCSPRMPTYRPSPYEAAEDRHAAIHALSLDDEGQTFTVQAQPVASRAATAVVRLTSSSATLCARSTATCGCCTCAATDIEDFEESSVLSQASRCSAGLARPDQPDRLTDTVRDTQGAEVADIRSSTQPASGAYEPASEANASTTRAHGRQSPARHQRVYHRVMTDGESLVPAARKDLVDTTKLGRRSESPWVPARLDMSASLDPAHRRVRPPRPGVRPVPAPYRSERPAYQAEA